MKIFKVSPNFTRPQLTKQPKTSFGENKETENDQIIRRFKNNIKNKEIFIATLEDKRKAFLTDILHYQKMLTGSKEVGSISSKVYYEARLENARTELEEIDKTIKTEKIALKIVKEEFKKLTDK